MPDKQWTEKQSNITGECDSCGHKTLLRMEPYTGNMMCKTCWESVVFDE